MKYLMVLVVGLTFSPFAVGGTSGALDSKALYLCQSVVTQRPDFDFSQYERTYRQLQINHGTVTSDMELNREVAVALIDYLISGPVNPYRNVGEIIRTADPKMTEKVIRVVDTIFKNRTASEAQIHSLVGRLIKILKNESVKKSVSEFPLWLRQNWNQVSEDQLVKIYLKIALTQGLSEAFWRMGLLRESSSLDRIRRFLSSSWVQSVLALGMAIPSTLLGMPPVMLPNANWVEDGLKKHQDLREKVLLDGVSTHLEELRGRLGWRGAWSFRVNSMVKAYNTIGLAIALAVLPSSVQEARNESAKQGLETWVSEISEQDAMTPERLGENLLSEYLVFATENGVVVSDLEKKQLREKFVAAFREAQAP